MTDTMPAIEVETITTLEPHPLTDIELRLLLEQGLPEEATAAAPEPTQQPPSTQAEAGAVGTALNGQKVTALWAEQSNRNAWANFQTSGWKRLSPLTDSGSTAMTLLAAHARATGSAPYADEDPAGTIAVMYVW